MEMENYRSTLRHIVRPEKQEERVDATSITVEDFEALYLVEALDEYAAYHADDETRAEIAQGYVEYIDMVVRDEQSSHVTLYAHTYHARAVLDDAVNSRLDHVNNLHNSLVERFADLRLEDA